MAVIDTAIIYGRISMQGGCDRAADRRLRWLPLETIPGNACKATVPVIDGNNVLINDGEHASAASPPGWRPGMGCPIRPGIGSEAVQWPGQGVAEAGEQKFIAMYANPADPISTGSVAVRRLRDKVVTASAERRFYVTPRNFTANAQHFAETAPIQPGFAR